MPGKFLKIEQAIEKSSCKSEIFLCHIVRPLTQLPCLGIERALFSQESGTLQGHLSGMLMAFAYIFVDLLEGKGESPHVFCITRKVIHLLLFHMVLISPGKSPRVFCITKKAIHQIFIEQEIHMSPCNRIVLTAPDVCNEIALCMPGASALLNASQYLPVIGNLDVNTQVPCTEQGASTACQGPN